LYCQKCGREEPLPFRCPFCGGYFCPEHRLPEAHDCTEAWQVKIPRQPEPVSPPPPSMTYSYQYGWTPPTKRPVFWFSPAEIIHVLIGAGLVSAVGLSLGRSLLIIGVRNMVFIAFAVGLFTLGFILHELAHKFTAQSSGLWAEFRLSTIGVVITTISILSPIKFIAPGMVLIAGGATIDIFGRVALAGPAINLAIGFVTLLSSLVAPAGFRQVLEIGSWVNTYMALFNLIPFGDFDGLKIFRWNKAVWALVVILAIALLISVSPFLS
jgi:Zn-dependent protease